MSLDTGTVRPGLEKSTYKIRRSECEQLAEMAGGEFGISCLADVRDDVKYAADHGLLRRHASRPVPAAEVHLFRPAAFLPHAGGLEAGDIVTVGALFREDGVGLRDDYQISGPELETMCDIVRTVPGVYGERMLGGGDKGASGALVAAGSVDAVRTAVGQAYPRSRPVVRRTMPYTCAKWSTAWRFSTDYCSRPGNMGASLPCGGQPGRADAIPGRADSSL